MPGGSLGARRVGASLGALLLVACNGGGSGGGGREQTPPPTASIAPAALASGSAAPRKPGAPDGGKAAASAEGARALLPEAGPPEPVPWEVGEVSRDTVPARESAGLELGWRVVWSDVPVALPTPESSREGLRDAAGEAALSLSVELALTGRARLVLTGGGFPLPRGTELRGRLDRLGALVVWPDGRSYRVLPPGAMRALFTERRADLLPLVVPRPSTAPARALLGQGVERTRWSTDLGEVAIDQARQPGSGWAGAVLCRWLVELAAVAPEAEGCGEDLIPLRAEYQWVGGGRLLFEATTLTRRADLAPLPLTVPPVGAAERVTGLPELGPGPTLTAGQLAALRTRPAMTDERPTPDAPTEGLAVENGTDRLTAVLIDGVTAAWVGSGHQVVVAGLRPGRYSVGFRDFLGERVLPATTTAVPARISVAP